MTTSKQSKPSAAAVDAKDIAKNSESRLNTARKELVDVMVKHKVTLPEFFYLIEIIKFDSLHGIRAKTDQERAANQANAPIRHDDRMFG